MVAQRTDARNGVTMVELIMVLFAIGVLLGLSLPLASALAGRFKVGSARDSFVSYYARARAAAVQYGRQGRIHIDPPAREFWVEVDTGVPGAIGADTLSRLNVAREYGGVTLSSTRHVLCFDSRGLPETGGICDPPDAVVVFARSDRVDTVRTSLGGTVVRK